MTSLTPNLPDCGVHHDAESGCMMPSPFEFGHTRGRTGTRYFFKCTNLPRTPALFDNNFVVVDTILRSNLPRIKNNLHRCRTKLHPLFLARAIPNDGEPAIVCFQLSNRCENASCSVALLGDVVFVLCFVHHVRPGHLPFDHVRFRHPITAASDDDSGAVHTVVGSYDGCAPCKFVPTQYSRYVALGSHTIEYRPP